MAIEVKTVEKETVEEAKAAILTVAHKRLTEALAEVNALIEALNAQN